MATLATLAVRLTADAAELQKGLTQAGETVQAVGKRMTDVGSTLSKTVTAPIAAVGAAAVASSLKLGSFADQLLDLEQQTGLSTTALQEYRFVAVDAGVASDAVAEAALALTKRLSSAGDDSKKLADALKLLGASVRDADGGIRSMDQVMPEIIASLAEMDDITTRNAIATDIFGGKARDLLPILGMSAAEIEAVQQRAHELGLVLSTDALNSANEFRIEADRLKAMVGATALAFGMTFLPELQSLVQWLQSSVIPHVRELVDWLTNLSPAVKMTGIVIGGLAAAIGPLVVALGTLVSSVGVILSLFGTTLPVALKVVLPFLGPTGLIAAGLIALAVVWIKWGDDIKAVVSAVVKWAADKFKAFGPIFEAVGNVVKALLSLLKSLLVGDFKGVVNAAGDLLSAYVSFWQPIYEFVRDKVVQPLLDFIGRMFGMVFRGHVDTAGRALDVMRSAFRGAVEFVQGLISRMMELLDNALVKGLGTIASKVGETLGRVTGFFRKMSDEVVGNSIVPDMVEMIGYELDDELGRVVQEAVGHTITMAAAFQDMADSTTAAASDLVDGLDTELGDTGRLGGIVNTFNSILGELGINLGGILDGILDDTKGWLGKLKELLTGKGALGFGEIVDNFLDLWQKVKDVVSKLANTINKVWDAANQFLGGGPGMPGGGFGGGGFGTPTPGGVVTLGLRVDLEPLKEVLEELIALGEVSLKWTVEGLIRLSDIVKATYSTAYWTEKIAAAVESWTAPPSAAPAFVGAPAPPGAASGTVQIESVVDRPIVLTAPLTVQVAPGEDADAFAARLRQILTSDPTVQRALSEGLGGMARLEEHFAGSPAVI